MNEKLDRVAVLMSTRSSFCRRISQGIGTYARPFQPWLLRIASNEPERLDEVRDWKPTGLIIHCGSEDLYPAVKKLGCPVVNVSRGLRDSEFLTVGIKDSEVGQLAAKHLIDRGYPRLAFCGDMTRVYGVDRRDGFLKQCKDAGIECHEFEWSDETSNGAPIRDGLSDKAQTHLREWIESLPKPIGLFAYQDYLGFTLSEVCRQIGLTVPEQVGLVGADDDEMVCQFAYPQLSSVRSPMEQVGYEAAHVLDKLMHGEKVDGGSILFSPTSVVTRRSTDITITADPVVSKALLFIRENADKPIQVEDVLDVVAISRRSLEHKFKALLNRTPLAEIHRVHIEQAKRLLTETELPISKIAARSGFSSTPQMNMVFRRIAGKSPSEFRRQPSNY